MILMSKKKSNFGKFVLGFGIGAGIGILFAPKSGEETRRERQIPLSPHTCTEKRPCILGSRLSLGTKSASTLILDFSSPRTIRNKGCLSHAFYIILL